MIFAWNPRYRPYIVGSLYTGVFLHRDTVFCVLARKMFIQKEGQLNKK